VEQDEHLLTVLRYIERNPLRAGLVAHAEAWPWSSLPWWSGAFGSPLPPYLHPGPVPRPANWVAWVNEPLTDAELAQVRQSVQRGTPFGTARWAKQTAARLGLQATLRPRGRPRKHRQPPKNHE